MKIKVPVRPATTTTVTPNEKFKDVDPDIDRKKNFVSIEQYEDKQFDLKRMELDLGIQVRFLFNKNLVFKYLNFQIGSTGIS